MSGPGPTPERDRTAPPARDPVTDVVRWAAFSCLLVPVVLVWCGSSLAGAAGAAFGLAAVTGACRLLMRRSQRLSQRLSRRLPQRLSARPPRDGGDTPVG